MLVVCLKFYCLADSLSSYDAYCSHYYSPFVSGMPYRENIDLLAVKKVPDAQLDDFRYREKLPQH